MCSSRRSTFDADQFRDDLHVLQARKDLLDARRTDIEETPGSRFLKEHERSLPSDC